MLAFSAVYMPVLSGASATFAFILLSSANYTGRYSEIEGISQLGQSYSWGEHT